MSQVLHDIEKKIIDSLQKKSEQTPEQLSESTELSIDQIRRGIEWLRLKELAQVKESSKVEISLGQNGIDAFKNGLPERKLMDLIKDGPKTFDDSCTCANSFSRSHSIPRLIWSIDNSVDSERCSGVCSDFFCNESIIFFSISCKTCDNSTTCQKDFLKLNLSQTKCHQMNLL